MFKTEVGACTQKQFNWVKLRLYEYLTSLTTAGGSKICNTAAAIVQQSINTTIVTLNHKL